MSSSPYALWISFVRACSIPSQTDWQRPPHRPRPHRHGRRPQREIGFSWRAGWRFSAHRQAFRLRFCRIWKAGYQLRSWVRATVSAFGLGTRPTLQAQEGLVRIDQSFTGLGLTFTHWPWWRLLPHAELGAGAYHLVAEGIANTGFQGQRMTAWSLGGRAALGVTASLSRHFFLDLTAGILWLMPEPRLYSLNTLVASTGHLPGLALRLWEHDSDETRGHHRAGSLAWL